MKHILAFKWVSIMLVVLIVAAAIGCGKRDTVSPTPTPTAMLTATATAQSTGETGTLSSVTGDVTVQRQGAGSWTAAISGTKIWTGDSLKTGSNGYVLITFFDGNVMEVNASTEITVEELGRTSGGSTTVHINQVIGNTINRVENLVDSSSSYEVETAAGSAVVRGTAFEMRVDQYGELSHSCVSTLKGNDGKTHSVDFSGGGVAVNVPEGMTSCCWAGGIPGAPFYTDPADDPLRYAGDGGGGGGQREDACERTQWHTFYGSASRDFGYAVALDGSGNTYVTGRSRDTWNGSAGQPPLHAHSDPGTAADVFILKLDRCGGYQWHTFYGTNGSEGHVDYGDSIAVDESNVYVTGFSWGPWNGSAGEPPKHDYTGSEGYNGDIFVLKLDQGGSYEWHTFFGSPSHIGDGQSDEGHDIVLDGSSNVYVTGISSHTWNGSSEQPPLHAHSNGLDVVVLKLDASGVYQWHTFYGSETKDEGFAIARDTSNNIFIAGRSYETWNGSADEPPLHAYSGDPGSPEMMVLKLNSSGGYRWHTFYGAANIDSSGEEGRGIAVDGDGNIYVTGKSRDTWNGSAEQSPINPFAGNDDITVLKLNTSGGYQWHTFFGSSGANDYGLDIGIDGNSNLYVVGRSNETWNGSADELPLHGYAGGADITVLKLNSSGGYQWHTFYGSSGGDDRGQAIAVKTVDTFHVVGYSPASWLRDDDAGPLHAYTGSEDIFILYKVP